MPYESQRLPTLRDELLPPEVKITAQSATSRAIVGISLNGLAFEVGDPTWQNDEVAYRLGVFTPLQSAAWALRAAGVTIDQTAKIAGLEPGTPPYEEMHLFYRAKQLQCPQPAAEAVAQAFDSGFFCAADNNQYPNIASKQLRKQQITLRSLIYDDVGRICWPDLQRTQEELGTEDLALLVTLGYLTKALHPKSPVHTIRLPSTYVIEQLASSNTAPSRLTVSPNATPGTLTAPEREAEVEAPRSILREMDGICNGDTFEWRGGLFQFDFPKNLDELGRKQAVGRLFNLSKAQIVAHIKKEMRDNETLPAYILSPNAYTSASRADFLRQCVDDGTLRILSPTTSWSPNLTPTGVRLLQCLAESYPSQDAAAMLSVSRKQLPHMYRALHRHFRTEEKQSLLLSAYSHSLLGVERKARALTTPYGKQHLIFCGGTIVAPAPKLSGLQPEDAPTSEQDMLLIALVASGLTVPEALAELKVDSQAEEYTALLQRTQLLVGDNERQLALKIGCGFMAGRLESRNPESLRLSSNSILLTPELVSILQRVACGLSDRQIAKETNQSENTVRAALKNFKQNYHFASDAAAVLYGFTSKQLQLDNQPHRLYAAIAKLEAAIRRHNQVVGIETRSTHNPAEIVKDRFGIKEVTWRQANMFINFAKIDNVSSQEVLLRLMLGEDEERISYETSLPQNAVEYYEQRALQTMGISNRSELGQMVVSMFRGGDIMVTKALDLSEEFTADDKQLLSILATGLSLDDLSFIDNIKAERQLKDLQCRLGTKDVCDTLVAALASQRVTL